MRPTMHGAMPMSMRRIAMNGNAAFETSPAVTFASSSRERGPAIESPTCDRPSASTRTGPSAGRCVSNQRIWYCSATPEPKIIHSCTG